MTNPQQNNDSTHQRRLQVRNPRSGKYDYSINAMNASQLAARSGPMRAAQQEWHTRGVGHRIEVMTQWAESLQSFESEIIEALSVDTGREAISRAEYQGLISAISRWSDRAPDLLNVESQRSAYFAHINLETMLVPYSLVGVISPWNFPLTLSFIDAIPALLAGSAVMIKPSEVTPRFVAPVEASLKDVPDLRKVLGFATGDGETGQALIDVVDAIAFTGSVATGRKVGQSAAAAFIPAFLELGGKDPAIVLADADVDRATTALLRGSVQATGQACQSVERIYVDETLFEPFVEMLVEKARKVTLTLPNTRGGILGPLIFDRQADIIRRHIEDARSQGATVLTGGEILEVEGGLWLEPTVITGVSHEMQVMTEETFGPVMPVMPFRGLDEAVKLANDTEFGLSGCVFSANQDLARTVAARIDAGGISINDAALTAMVFEIEKNSFNHSGLGASRMGPSGMLRFLRKKALYINEGEVLGIEVFTEK